MLEIKTRAQQVDQFVLHRGAVKKSRGKHKHGRMSSVLQIAFVDFPPLVSNMCVKFDGVECTRTRILSSIFVMAVKLKC